MNVTLLRLDGLDVAMLAASVCVSETMPTEPKPDGLVKALRSGHDSLLEHITVSFAIEGISRVCLAQLCRHRHISLSVQSQRYVDVSGAECVIPSRIVTAADDEDFMETMRALNRGLQATIAKLRASGVPGEDARYLYPQGITTNLILTTNLRELSHICGLRRCARAQEEINILVSMMATAVQDRIYRKVGAENPRLYSTLARRFESQCVQLGYCPEVRTCGFKPQLAKLQDAYDNQAREADPEGDA